MRAAIPSPVDPSLPVGIANLSVHPSSGPTADDELQRLKGLLPPEMQSWVFVEASCFGGSSLITLEEIGRDEVEIQSDLEKWDSPLWDHRNLLFWQGGSASKTIPSPATAGKWRLLPSA